jgi:hypothetical protein
MRWADEPAMESHALEHAQPKPVAVIIMGNPRYIDDPKLRTKAMAFYMKVKMFLTPRYEVKFDSGKPFTLPDTKAALWVGHSRGIDRLQYAPKGIRTIALQTQDHDQVYGSDDERGRDPKHYELSAQDIKALQSA